eukprot:TRINITY_DN867_c0_g2_i1.p1 TRINITY_DN867_c0_g2~~TRINITY_DN867_c0_g2_i1.p1  ORF type:complete len:336 (+),score=42.08 TRINITY_DN867_c0_g2_i1:533-1540(+)
MSDTNILDFIWLVTLPWDMMVCVGAVILFFTSSFSWYHFKTFQKYVSCDDKAVLVTGAASGIGRTTTELLLSRGCFVYALDTNKKELERLYDGYSRVCIIYADVTKPKDIERAVRIVEETCSDPKSPHNSLWGIVNSAGILRVWPRKEACGTIELDLEYDVKPVFDVNLFGIMRVNSAFAPMLFKSKGRIVNITSALGRFALRFVGPYCASKFALEGYSDCLRRELKDVDVKVSIIEPGYTDTPFVQKEKFTQILVDPSTTAFCSSIASGLSRNMKKFYSLQSPMVVAEAIFDALFAESPKARYLVDFSVNKFVYQLLFHLPDPFVDYLAKIFID